MKTLQFGCWDIRDGVSSVHFDRGGPVVIREEQQYHEVLIFVFLSLNTEEEVADAVYCCSNVIGK